MIFNGRVMDYFGGSGYLGLQNHPAVLQAAQEALQRYGFSTATSRGGFGEHPIYADLEKAACAYFGAEKVIYYASGYLGTAILTQATSNRFEHIFIELVSPFQPVGCGSCHQSAHHPLPPLTRPKPGGASEQ